MLDYNCLAYKIGWSTSLTEFPINSETPDENWGKKDSSVHTDVIFVVSLVWSVMAV